MIRNSFIFLEKIGSRKERSLWKQGVKDWQTFLSRVDIEGISAEKKYFYNRKIKEAQEALAQENYLFFREKWPSREMWRFYNLLKEECCFLDIEVDGYGKAILVGISNYFNTNFFVKGVNLEKRLLEKELKKYKLLVTFNGSSFDLPKLKKMEMEWDLLHIDLKPLCINLGLKGGLKEIEKTFNLKRPSHLKGNPVDLWKAFHASGDNEYLELLLEYNREDIENLKLIMERVYREMSAKIYKHIK